MAVRDDRSDVRQTTTGFRGPLMVQSLTSAKSKFLSLYKLFGVEAQEFKYFNKTVQLDAKSNSIIDCRYYCVVSNPENL